MQAEFRGDLFERPAPWADALTPPPAEGLVQELWAALGYDGLMRLLDRYGGVAIYIPLRMTESHSLAQTLGLETAQALCRFARNGEFAVPTGRNLRCALRNLEIRALRAQGLSLRALALRFRVSQQQICRILARA